MIWKIALGSVMRHRMRSVIIIAVVAISVAAMLFLTGMMDGMRRDFFETMVATGGHVQIDHADTADALDPVSLELLISDWRDLRRRLSGREGVLRVEPVLTFGGLMLVDGTSAPMQGNGVEPDTGFFWDVRSGLESGSFLDGSGSGVLISRETAGILEVDTGGTVSVLVEDSTGAPYYLAYEVRGIFRSDSPEFDASNFLIGHAAAQELLYLDDRTRELRVVLNDREAAAPFAAAVTAELAERPGQTLRVRDWREINGGLAVLIEMFDVFTYAINLLIVIVAATVITNAILMNIFEKIEEMGMMRAIGLTRRGQAALILAEGGVYGVLGSVAGMLIGVPLVLYFARTGIELGAATDTFGLGTAIYTRFDPMSTVLTALFGASVAVVGSLYAARTATRLSIMDSLRGSA